MPKIAFVIPVLDTGIFPESTDLDFKNFTIFFCSRYQIPKQVRNDKFFIFQPTPRKLAYFKVFKIFLKLLYQKICHAEFVSASDMVRNLYSQKTRKKFFSCTSFVKRLQLKSTHYNARACTAKQGFTAYKTQNHFQFLI